MIARDLFDYASRAHPARAGDPETSHDAARSIEAILPGLEGIVLRAVKAAAPGDATLDEVIQRTGLDKVTASPRFKPLEAKGLIVRAGKRAGFSGRLQTAWKPTT